MTSRGEQFMYVMALVGIITGLLGAATFVFYLAKGGYIQTEDRYMPMSTMLTGLFAYLAFRALPGFLGWRGCKKRDVRFVKAAFVLSAVAIVLSLAGQKVLPGIGTGFIFSGVYIIITFRYMRALTAEAVAENRKYIQKPGDGPRIG